MQCSVVVSGVETHPAGDSWDGGQPSSFAFHKWTTWVLFYGQFLGPETFPSNMVCIGCPGCDIEPPYDLSPHPSSLIRSAPSRPGWRFRESQPRSSGPRAVGFPLAIPQSGTPDKWCMRAAARGSPPPFADPPSFSGYLFDPGSPRWGNDV